MVLRTFIVIWCKNDLWSYTKGRVHGKTIHAGAVNKSIARASGCWCNASFAEDSHRFMPLCFNFNPSDAECTVMMSRNSMTLFTIDSKVYYYWFWIYLKRFLMLFMSQNLVGCLPRHQFSTSQSRNLINCQRRHHFGTKTWWAACLDSIFSYHSHV